MVQGRIHLINPYIEVAGRPRYYQTDWTSAEFSAAIRMPSLEFLGIHALLAREGFEAGFLDANDERLGAAAIAAHSRDFNPEWCVLYANSYTAPYVGELARRLKAEHPAVKIAAFGAPLTVNPDLVLRDFPVDYVILGEPELPALELCRGNSDRSVAFRRDGKTVRKSMLIADELDALPHLSRELLRPGDYKAPFTKSNPFSVVLTSRGCSYGKCLFCTQNVWTGSGVRYHSVDYVLEDLSRALSLGYREIFFRDEVFTENRARTLDLCEAITRAGLKFTWRAMTRVSLVDAELLTAMKAAGCYQISYGFETSSPEALKASKKGQSLAMAETAARLTREVGVEIVGNFVVGLQGDTRDHLADVSRYAKKLGCAFAQFTVADTWNGYVSAATSGAIAKGELERLARRAYYRFYLDPRFLLRMMIRVLKRPALIPVVIRTFYRSLFNPILT